MNHVGIDVGSKELIVAIHVNGKSQASKSFENTPEGVQSLVRCIAKQGPARVCLEATGTYHFDAAIALSDAENMEVMVVNPKASKHFAAALMTRNKTDREPDLEVELSLLSTEEGGRKHPLWQGCRLPQDFGLPNELNDGMYEFLGKPPNPGGSQRAHVWLLAPERNQGRIYEGFAYRIWEGYFIGHGKVLRVINPILKVDAEQALDKHAPHPRGLPVIQAQINVRDGVTKPRPASVNRHAQSRRTVEV